MRVPRIVIENNQATDCGKTITISNENFHHLVNVLRCKINNIVEVIFPKQSSSFTGEIININQTNSTLEILLTKLLEPTTARQITLLCGFPKPPTADFIVEKAVELDVAQIIFFNAERTQNHLTLEQQQKKLERLKKIKEAATKQSGFSGKDIEIKFISSLEYALNSISTEPLQMIFALSDNARKITDVIQNHNDDNAIIIIGPEGGLTQQEIGLAQSKNFIPTSLGVKTLRTETAVIAACAILGIT